MRIEIVLKVKLSSPKKDEIVNSILKIVKIKDVNPHRLNEFGIIDGKVAKTTNLSKIESLPGVVSVTKV